jgi:hypothetical protein
MSGALRKLALAALAVGVLASIAGALAGRAATILGVLAAAWLLCAGIAAGAVALSAAIRLARGRWAASVTPIAEAASGFFPVALGLLAILVLAAPAWIPDARAEGWIAWGARVARELVASAALFVAGVAYVRRSRAGAPGAGAAAVVYLLLYVGTLSLWATDFVIALMPGAPSTVLPPLYFGGAFLSGLAFTTLVVTVRGVGEVRTRRDLGGLVFAFVIFWGYLVWAAYLPVWYENLPDETGALLLRWAGGWRYLSGAVLFTILAFPFFALLGAGTKRRRGALAGVAGTILAGLVGERLLLVLPSLALPGGVLTLALGAAVEAGVVGAFVLTSGVT